MLLGHPERIWAVAALFGVLFIVTLTMRKRLPRVRRWPILAVCFLWSALGYLEYNAVVSKANIRIDAIITYPTVYVLTTLFILTSALSVVHAIRRSRSITEQDETKNG